jgi:hypothetical protein
MRGICVWRPFLKAPCTISLNDHSQMVLRIDSPIDSSPIVDGADRGRQTQMPRILKS